LKVLFISYDGMTDPLGQSQVIPYLKGLSALGHEISILSCEKKIRFEIESVEIKKLLDSNNIKWFPIFYIPSPPVLSSIKDVWNIRKKSREICKNEGIEMILSQLSKLRSLTLYEIEVNLDFKLIFTQMKALRSLSLRFDDD
jgi:hypothetical protein